MKIDLSRVYYTSKKSISFFVYKNFSKIWFFINLNITNSDDALDFPNLSSPPSPLRLSSLRRKPNRNRPADIDHSALRKGQKKLLKPGKTQPNIASWWPSTTYWLIEFQEDRIINKTKAQRHENQTRGNRIHQVSLRFRNCFTLGFTPTWIKTICEKSSE